MISGERKKFKLVGKKRKPKGNPRLSTTVLIEQASGITFGYIGFAEDLVEFVGKRLPRGIGPHDPAFLVVAEDSPRGVWVVKAQYYHDEVTAALWETATKPEWLNNSRGRGQDGNSKNAHPGGTGGRGSENDGNYDSSPTATDPPGGGS